MTDSSGYSKSEKLKFLWAFENRQAPTTKNRKQLVEICILINSK
jgi:hypothetical protein